MPFIEIVEYNPNWPHLFAREKERICAVMGVYIADVQHIGSTAVPGLGAKPIIDILIGLKSLRDVESCIEPMRSLGYEWLGENGIPGRHFFRNPPGSGWVGRLYNVHMVEMGSHEWEKHIAFRDYLRSHPEEAERYYQLKKELATAFGSDPVGHLSYPAAKTSFIEAILKKARL